MTPTNSLAQIAEQRKAELEDRLRARERLAKRHDHKVLLCAHLSGALIALHHRYDEELGRVHIDAGRVAWDSERIAESILVRLEEKEYG